MIREDSCRGSNFDLFLSYDDGRIVGIPNTVC